MIIVKISDARKKANKKWNDANMKERYDRVAFLVPKGHKATVQRAADQEKESINGYVNKAVLAHMGLEGWPKKTAHDSATPEGDRNDG